MNMITSTIATALTVIISCSSFAVDKADPLKNLNSENILAAYLDAVTLGHTQFNEQLFARDFEYHNTANEDKHGKRAYMKFLKQNKGLQFTCKKTYQILDECGSSCLAKVTIEFDDFVRVDHITLSQTKVGWQISKVITTYP